MWTAGALLPLFFLWPLPAPLEADVNQPVSQSGPICTILVQRNPL